MDLVRDLLLHPKPVPRKNTRKYSVLDRNIVSSLLQFCVCVHVCVCVCVSDVYGSQSMVEQFDKINDVCFSLFDNDNSFSPHCLCVCLSLCLFSLSLSPSDHPVPQFTVCKSTNDSQSTLRP